MMNVLRTNIEGVLIIEPKVFGDSRGYFFESFNSRQRQVTTLFLCKTMSPSQDMV